MRVKCMICEKVDQLETEDPLAKKLRNRPIHTYLCNECNERIAKKTNERKESGNFILYRGPKQEEEW